MHNIILVIISIILALAVVGGAALLIVWLKYKIHCYELELEKKRKGE